METSELSPDGRRSIAYFRSLEQAIEQATAMLSTRPDVGQFRIHAATGLVPPARGDREPGSRFSGSVTGADVARSS
jgi:hypothetical protein